MLQKCHPRLNLESLNFIKEMIDHIVKDGQLSKVPIAFHRSEMRSKLFTTRLLGSIIIGRYMEMTWKYSMDDNGLIVGVFGLGEVGKMVIV
ncbi:hypothetical protein AQUCO_00800243v1 [Aquilegia coerulea]|uniref:Uncharacterized protein n=1 Tax=Aquilegia coerulea TaxID=218851 RepID=A0A2G5EIE2_AQUCA|nr:hypothetical protein AQUCO_00800243v1 [Aquilegia coerulea]